MPITDYLRILLRRWWLVLLPVVVITVFTVVTAFPQVLPRNRYQVVVRFGIGLPPEQNGGGYNYDRQYVWTASEYTNQALADALVTGKFAEAIAKRTTALGVPVPASQYQGGVTRDYRGSILTVSVIGNTAEEAVAMGQAVTDELTENSSAYFQQLSKSQVSPVRALDNPIPILLPPPPRSTLDLPVRVLLGFLVGAALAFVSYFIDPLLHDRRDVQRMDIPVMGEIPA